VTAVCTKPPRPRSSQSRTRYLGALVSGWPAHGQRQRRLLERGVLRDGAEGVVEVESSEAKERAHVGACAKIVGTGS
jgi:hypothetical protein